MFSGVGKTCLGFAFALLVMGCITDKEGEKKQTEPAAGVGRILLWDGRPAEGARVRFYTVNHIPVPGVLAKSAGLAYEARTNEAGEYTLDSIAPGEYNILSELEGAMAMADSVLVGAKTILPSDTLRIPGSIAGIVQLQPNHDPRTVTLQVLGTYIFGSVGKDGRFLLENLPQGPYNLRVMTTLGEYTVLHRNFRIRSGKQDSLPPLTPLFTGLPVVVGLTAAYDTLEGRVKLRWNATDYSFLEEYLVYRSNAEALNGSEALVARIRDTIYSENLFMESQEDGPFSGNEYDYSVRIKSLSGQISLRFGSVRVEAVSPAHVRTFSNLTVSNNARIGIHDTILLVLRYDNPGRRIRKVEWYEDNGRILKTKPDSSLGGEDSLRIAWPESGNKEVRVVMTDDGGVASFETARIRVEAGLPIVETKPRIEVGILDSVHLVGNAWDEFGQISKLEWDVGNTGQFTEVKDGRISFQAPAVPTPFGNPFRCIFRATDDLGQSSTAEAHITVHLDPPIPNAGNDTSINMGGMVRLTNEAEDRFGYIEKWEWDVGATGNFQTVTLGDTIVAAPARLDSNYLCILRVTDNRGVSALDTVRVQVMAWRTLKSASMEVEFSQGVGNTIIGLKGDGSTEEYHIQSNMWFTMAKSKYNVVRLDKLDGTAAAFSSPGSNARVEKWNPIAKSWDSFGKHSIYPIAPFVSAVVGNQWLEVYPHGEYGACTFPWTFDPALRRSTRLTTYAISGLKISPSALIAIDNRAILMHGLDLYGNPVATMESYDALTGEWTVKSPRNNAGPVHAAFEAGGLGFVLGESGSFEAYNPATDEWMPRSVPPGFDFDYRFDGVDRPLFLIRNGKAHLFARTQGRIMAWTYDIAEDSWSVKPSWQHSYPGLYRAPALVAVQNLDRIFIHYGREFLEYQE